MDIKASYDQKGYAVSRALFRQDEINPLRAILEHFHCAWKKSNWDFYSEKAVNSAYLTAPPVLDEIQRIALFQFISSPKVMAIVDAVLPTAPTFMNTQLFFDPLNPLNPLKQNYWHRDPQYHLSITEQQKALKGVGRNTLPHSNGRGKRA